MHNTVVIDGELSLIFDELAEGSLEIPESGECGVFMAMREAYPNYTGPTVITPSEEEQVLQTTMKTVTQNIVVTKIPENYGRLIWNGNKLTVY